MDFNFSKKYIESVIQLNQNNSEGDHIFFCSDVNYLKYVGVTITNILLIDKNKYIFHIFVDQITQDNLFRLKETAKYYNVNIYIYIIKKEFINAAKKASCTKSHLSDAIGIICFRFIAPQIINSINREKILYLDVDIIVKKEINNIFKLDLKEKIVGAVEDVSSDVLSNIWKTKKYFNAGVLLIDINKWRNENITEKCLEMLNSNKFIYLDQDILNIVLNNNVNYISPIYNYQYSLSRIFNKGCACKKLNNDVIIYHFIGSDKPWHTWVQYIDIVKEYIYIYRKSFWNNIMFVSINDLDTEKQYKYMHRFSRNEFKNKNYPKSFYWFIKYIFNKIKYLIK